MKFQFNGHTFKLEFQRQHKQVQIVRKGKHHAVKSKFPYTSVTLFALQEGKAPRVVDHTTVGCLTSDPYSHENGRLSALRSLTKIMAKKDQSEAGKDFRAAIWHAYLNRKQEQNVVEAAAVTPVHTAGQQLALPPASPTVADLNNLDTRVIH